GVHALPEVGDDGGVDRVGGADEALVVDEEMLPGLAEADDDAVGERFGLLARLLRRADDLLPVLVGAGEHEGVLPAGAVVAREGVGDDGRIRVADVRRVVDVVDGGRDVKRSHASQATYHAFRPRNSSARAKSASSSISTQPWPETSQMAAGSTPTMRWRTDS